MEDGLAFTDESALPLVELPPVINGWNTEDKYQHFKTALYDWSNFSSKQFGYEVIHLGGKKGFFVIVDKCDYKRLSQHKWKPRVIYAKDEHGDKTDQIVRVDACRTVRTKDGESTIYMHREITGAGALLDVDHKNGVALDNRRKNLRCVGRTQNNHNWSFRTRPVHNGLPRGVVMAFANSNQVRGIIWWSTKNGNRKCLRSEKSWPLSSADKAHAWYLKERKKLYKHNVWAVGGTAPSLPEFPPFKKSVVSSEDLALQATF